MQTKEVHQMFSNKISAPLSQIGLGTGDFFWNSNLTEDQKVCLIQTAIENGINFIDTAEGYGNGSSESTIGNALQGMRNRVVLATKFSPEHHSFDEVLRSCENSLKRLKIDQIDLYQMHWPNPAVPLQDTARALVRLAQEKQITAVGVSNCSLRDLEEMRRYLGDVPLISVQMEYNLLERTVEKNGIFDFCRQSGSLMLAYSPLDQGQLSALGSDRCRLLQGLAKKYNVTIPQLILRWITNQKFVVAITRTTSIEHLLENAKATSFSMSDQDMQCIDEMFPIDCSYVPTEKIQISLHGEWNHQVYQTLEEAKENKLHFVPSPTDLAKSIMMGDCLKPVRLKRKQDNTDGYEYELVAGRIRYWAWVIAQGENSKPIPAYIRETEI